jgi:hypothetical protein
MAMERKADHFLTIDERQMSQGGRDKILELIPL